VREGRGVPRAAEGAEIGGNLGSTAQPQGSYQPASGTAAITYSNSRVVDAWADRPIPWAVRIGTAQGAPVRLSGPLAITSSPNYDGADIYARITVGVGASRFTFDVDVGLGVTVPVFGTHVTVDIFAPADAAEAANGFIYPAVVGLAAPGEVPISKTPLIRSVLLGTVAGLDTQSAFFNVPLFARRATMIANIGGSTETIADMTLQFYRQQSTTLLAAYYHSNVLNLATFNMSLPVPPDAGRFRVRNQNSAARNAVRVYFELAL
jgi:hypothetical protein